MRSSREIDYSDAVSSYRHDRYGQAIDELQTVRDEPGMIGAMAGYYHAMSSRALGIEALREGEYAAAEAHFLQAGRVLGRTAGLAEFLASVYARTGRLERCVAEISGIADQDRDAVHWRKLAVAQWRAGRRELARLTLCDAIRRVGDHSDLHLQSGLFNASEEHFDEARADLLRAVELDCTDPDAHYYLGLTEAAAGDPLAAARSFQRAFSLQPTNLLVARQLALAASAVEQGGARFIVHIPEQTPATQGSEISQLAAYIAGEPDFLDACLSLPRTPGDAELFELLSGIIRTAIRQRDGFADLHYYNSRVLDRLDRTDQAMREAERALEINPAYVNALIHLADMHARYGMSAEAADLLARATRSGADWADIHCRAGELLLHCGLAVRAKRHLNRALELNRNYTKAADVLAAAA